MSDTTAAPDVHRLLDIVVEEVSLVDRAANKHRFLIVKRSDEPMDDNVVSSPEDQTNGPGAAPDDEAGDQAQTAGEEALAVAVDALRILTEAVEALSHGGEPPAARLVEVATGLQRAAEQLTTMATGSEAKASDEAAGALLGSAEEVLAQAKVTCDHGARPDSGAQDHGRSPATHSKPAATTEHFPSAALAKQLGQLVDAVRTLTSTVTAQQQRLGRLEKSFGLPNSRPPGERTAQRDAEDTGWPLDLNKPFDRASVDKSVSFHDV